MDRESRLQPLARAVLRTQSDHRLVGLAREGRDSAFDEIVRRYRPGLVAFAAAYAQRDSAEDVVQESFTAAWRTLQESDTEIQLKPWLYTIVRNRALNARRDARPHELLTEEIGGVRGPDEIALTKEELSRAVAAVGALPDPQRQALVRSALDGHTHVQIAAGLGSTPGAVGQLVFRARAALRTGLGALIPLPLIRLLLEPAGPAAAGATGAGAAAAATGGASILTKGAAVALIGVAAVGSGVAIDHATESDAKNEPAASPSHSNDSSSGGGPDATTIAADGSGEPEVGDDHGGGPGPSDGRRGEAEAGDDRGGDGGSGEDRGRGPSSGPSPESGSGSGSSGSDASGSGGSGTGGSGHSGHGGGGSGSSGSGSGGGSSRSSEATTTTEIEGTTTTTTTTTETSSGDDGSGSNDGSSGSGSGSSNSGGSSGPG
jgi:RNA polymerase sigma factor (sigma-70 family)